MFAAISPDGVILSTPTPLHVSQGLECIEKSCPVLVEKPLATSAIQAKILTDAAEQASVPLLVGHHRRHNPLIQKAKELIVSGEIGNIRALQATCWFYKPDEYFDIAPWRTQKGAGPISQRFHLARVPERRVVVGPRAFQLAVGHKHSFFWIMCDK